MSPTSRRWPSTRLAGMMDSWAKRAPQAVSQKPAGHDSGSSDGSDFSSVIPQEPSGEYRPTGDNDYLYNPPDVVAKMRAQAERANKRAAVASSTGPRNIPEATSSKASSSKAKPRSPKAKPRWKETAPPQEEPQEQQQQEQPQEQQEPAQEIPAPPPEAPGSSSRQRAQREKSAMTAEVRGIVARNQQ